jgi:hypothetical protein
MNASFITTIEEEFQRKRGAKDIKKRKRKTRVEPYSKDEIKRARAMMTHYNKTWPEDAITLEEQLKQNRGH